MGKYSSQEILEALRPAHEALTGASDFNLPKLLTGRGIDQPQKIEAKLMRALHAVEETLHMLTQNTWEED
jgi:hypothetical protein